MTRQSGTEPGAGKAPGGVAAGKSGAEVEAPADGEGTDGVAAVDRALLIAMTLERHAAPLKLADLARATGLYKSTLLRLLASLERAALVIRRDDGSYVLGHMAFRLGRAYETTHHLKESVYPVLVWLVDQGSESASFHVFHDRRHRLCMFRIDSKHPTLDSIRAGDLLPMDRGAPAKVLRQLSSTDFVQVSFGEREASCAAVSTPVFAGDGSIAGALSLSGPAERFTAGAVKHMSKLILQAAGDATRSLGGQWPETHRSARRA